MCTLCCCWAVMCACPPCTAELSYAYETTNVFMYGPANVVYILKCIFIVFPFPSSSSCSIFWCWIVISFIQLTSSRTSARGATHSFIHFDSFDLELELSPPIFRTHNSRILNYFFFLFDSSDVCVFFISAFSLRRMCRVSSLFVRSLLCVVCLSFRWIY